MPFGNFFLIVNEKAQVEKKVIFTNENLQEGVPEVKIGENELIRIRMGHSDKKYVLTTLADFMIYSIKEDLKENKKNYSFFGGIIATKDEENISVFKDPLQMFLNEMMENRAKSEGELKELLKDAFSHYFQAPKVGFDLKELNSRLSDRVKSLNMKGKFDDANILLDKMKKIPPKLSQAFNNAEDAIKKQDYEKAEKDFFTALKYAEDLEEKDIAKIFKERAQMSRRIPDLLKKRDDYAEKAVQSLRSDNFNEAAKFFKLASDVSRELLDTRHADEYSQKAKALTDYIKVDKKFSK